RSLRWCLDDCADSSECVTEREKEPPEGTLIEAEIRRQGRAVQEAEGEEPVGWDAEGSIEEEVRRAVASVEEACQPSSAMVPSGADEQHSVGCQNSNGEATIVETSSFEMPSGRLDEHAHAESAPPVGVVERSFDSKGEENVTSSRSDDVAMGDSSPVSTLSSPQGRSDPPTSLLASGDRPCDATDDSDEGIVRDDLKQRPSGMGGDLSVPSGDLEEVLQDSSPAQYAPCPMDDAAKPCSPESAVSLLRSSPEAESPNEEEPLPQAAVITVVTASWDKSDDDGDSVISSDGGDIDWETVKSRAKVRILRAIQSLSSWLIMPSFYITGCDSGFGRDLVSRLYEKGHQVFAGCLLKQSIDDIGKEFPPGQGKGRVVAILLDVTDEASVHKAAETIKGLTDRLDGLVNNAGILIDAGPAEWSSTALFRKMLEVNVIGMSSVMKSVVDLIRQAQGRIVNVASLAGGFAFPC
ncbi:Dehydrogenase, partial [Perkinsus olseni]